MFNHSSKPPKESSQSQSAINKIITIIVPTYNMEAYLNTCLRSLIIDDINAVEVIVVNDGSKDNSVQIAEKFVDKYPTSFKIINKENGNYGSCINRGLAEASGKYIKVLDADDSFDTANFQKMVSLLKNLDVELFISTTIHVYKTHEEEKPLPFPQNQEFDFIRTLRKKDILGKLWMHDVAYKRDIFKELNYRQSEGIYYTDNEWKFKPMAMVKKAYYMVPPLYRYLLDRQGQSVSIDIMKTHIYDDAMVTIKMLRDYNEMRTLCPALDKIFYNIIFHRVVWMYRRTLVSWQLFNNADLIKFDDLLKEENYQIYNKAGHILLSTPLLPFKYISIWRRNPQSKLLKRIVKLYHLKKRYRL